jgi:nitrile hydratase
MTARLRFAAGDRVRVRPAYPPGHVRAPFFARGKSGIVLDVFGTQPNPEERAYGRDGRPELPLYHVLFKQTELWSDYKGSAKDTAVVAVYENWLEPMK